MAVKNPVGSSIYLDYVSLDCTNLVIIYPKIKAAEVKLSALKHNNSTQFQDNETKLAESKLTQLHACLLLPKVWSGTWIQTLTVKDVWLSIIVAYIIGTYVV